MRSSVIGLLFASAAVAVAAGCAGPENRAGEGSPDTQEPPQQIGARGIGEAIVTPTRYYAATGAGPVYEVEPGAPVFASRLGEASTSRPADAADALFSDDVKKIDGEISIEAVDRVSEDQALAGVDADRAGDKALVKGWFRGADGVRYEFSLDRVLPAQPGSSERTHFGGVGTDVTLHGDSPVLPSFEPKAKAGVAIFGIGVVRREGDPVGEFPFEVTVASRTRSPQTGRYLGEVDATRREVDQVDLLIRTGRGVDATAAAGLEMERTLPAGQRKEGARGPDLASIPGFHIVWTHASVKFKP